MTACENTCPIHSKLSFYSVNCKTCNIQEKPAQKGPHLARTEPEVPEPPCGEFCRHSTKCKVVQKLLTPSGPRAFRSQPRGKKRYGPNEPISRHDEIEELRHEQLAAERGLTSDRLREILFLDDKMLEIKKSKGWLADGYYGREKVSAAVEFPLEEFRNCNDIDKYEKFLFG